MRVHSFLPLLGLSLATVAFADGDSTSDDVEYVHGVVTGPAVNKRAAVPATPVRRVKRDGPGICEHLPTKWSYIGCYKDSVSARALNGPSYCDDDGLAEEKCIEFCDAKGYSIAGLEYGSECYCGYSLGPSGTKASELDCNMPCTGSTDELCGAGDRMNVFTNGDPAPTVLASSGAFTSIGCYSDDPSARILENRQNLPGNVRVEDCTSACSAAGYSYAGLEFGSECFCGNSILNGGHSIDASSCSMVCTADKSELCGGPGAINLYQVPSQSTSTCGLAGCRFSNNLIQQYINNVNLQQCMAYCKAEPTCIDIQYGNDVGETGVCNLLSAPITDVYAYGYETDPYCMTYHFYDNTCAV